MPTYKKPGRQYVTAPKHDYGVDEKPEIKDDRKLQLTSTTDYGSLSEEELQQIREGRFQMNLEPDAAPGQPAKISLGVSTV